MANDKIRHKKDKPEVVTGDFELHFEEVVNRNRYTLVAFLTSGFLLLALVVPGAVYYSKADTKNVSVEAETGIISNSEFVNTLRDDNGGGDTYIEFTVPSL